MTRTPEQLLQYLQENVRPDGDCLIWAGAVNNGRRPVVQHQYKQHDGRRLMLQLLGHKIDGKCVWTHCHPLCMTVSHIRIGYFSQMMRAKRDRFPRGTVRAIEVALSRKATAKVGIAQARELAAAQAAGATTAELAARYGVTQQAISYCLKRWRVHGVIA